MSLREQILLHRLGRALQFSDTHAVQDVVALVKEGRMQVWERDGAVMVTELVDTPLRRALHYFAVAGQLDAVRILQDEVDTWGRQQGASRAEAIGRLGWERVPQPEGWERRGGWWTKELHT